MANEMHRDSPMHQPNDAGQRWTTEAATWIGDAQASAARAMDECLIDSVLRGRTDAFGDLVTPHLGSLTRFARMRLRNDSEAEDVVQQAVLQAFHRLGQFRREASFKTWLSKITSNQVIHLRRGKAVCRVQPLCVVRPEKLADKSMLPDAQIQRQEDVEGLHRALRRLPEKYRTIIQLRDLHELSIAATARSLSLSVAAVKTRHHRARKLLLRSLSGIK
jgi:RNA polymerase sigma-70 factor (ECF subfamily)